MVLLIGGIALIVSGLRTLVEGARPWRGSILPAWSAWTDIILGIIICVVAVWYMRQQKGRPKEPEYTDEEAARAEAAMDAMYLREHGELPEKPRKDEK